ncbi:MAG: hypothetical protein C0623_10345 [Desulfuromonas sp.]|nr:MAG: hypothetical protein C0623_10345 [Desulfuromonas sp.]
MHANLSRQITLLGLGAMLFYGALFASGQVSVEILPQFAVSAIFFLFSGKIMRQIASRLPEKEQKQKEEPEIDWTFRTNVLNWVSASLIISIMVIVLVKPADTTYANLTHFPSEDYNDPIVHGP